jgi:predicted alpha/beta-hydrolase family hydrolase
MGRRPANVTKTEIKETVKAVVDAGVEVARVEVDIKAGRITMFAGKPGEPLSNESGSWDKAIADLKARQ